jgi:hypothetical protein
MVAAVSLTSTVCWAQENKHWWDQPGDLPYTEEECEGEATPEQHCHHNHDIFFSPHYYDKEYQPLTPAPDWPGANNNFIEQMTR